ncbi:MAG: atrA protein [Pseudonocardiales bacterium]|jgi:polar amino acid transport system substrate-binding protein|nr:atrA protein [Pseudonocardiales bacterium]
MSGQDKPRYGGSARAKSVVFISAAACIAAAVAGCSSSKGSASQSAANVGKADATLAAMLPDNVRKSGVIRVASELDYAPVEYLDTDGKTPIGAELEVGTAVADRLGVRLKITNLAFDPTIPAINANRFDTSMTYIGDKVERQAQVDFVDVFRSGYSVMVRKGNPKHINGLADLCGVRVSVQIGAANTAVVQDQSKACVAAGKPAVQMSETKDAAGALLQLKSDRVDAHLEDAPVAAQTAKVSGGGKDFEVVGKQVTIRNHGWIFRKADTKLRDAMQAGLKAIIADGTYGKILDKWGLQSISLTTASVNDATITN